jgi:hypothetical protein
MTERFFEAKVPDIEERVLASKRLRIMETIYGDDTSEKNELERVKEELIEKTRLFNELMGVYSAERNLYVREMMNKERLIDELIKQVKEMERKEFKLRDDVHFWKEKEMKRMNEEMKKMSMENDFLKYEKNKNKKEMKTMEDKITYLEYEKVKKEDKKEKDKSVDFDNRLLKEENRKLDLQIKEYKTQLNKLKIFSHKTVMCKFAEKCRNGKNNNCGYAHGEDELRCFYPKHCCLNKNCKRRHYILE